MTIRAATAADAAAIDTLVTQAFGQDAEARLVERLRASDRMTCELVAEEDGAIVGQITFSPIRIGENDGDGRWWGLAPLAVAPARQKQGIGTALVRVGLDAARLAGVTLVVVLGEPAYYGRFGFLPAGRLGLRCVYEVPGEYFMACQPVAGVLPAGTVHYDVAFDGL
ncbi:MAG TPA: N-acetyltransferase [Geminicoccaceae bacterium]|nr:N-acetyltransferase [Geminicoccus sp.]HMU48487.1 N-acetyltransferase [Geminicoccaceae bacterium]